MPRRAIKGVDRPSSDQNRKIFSLLRSGDEVGFAATLAEKFGTRRRSTTASGRLVNGEWFATDECKAIYGVTTLSLMHEAARLGSITALRQLIEAGAPVDPPDSAHRSPLLYAAREGHCNACQYLVQSGAAPLGKIECKLTPLHAAAACGHVAVCAFLVETGGVSPDVLDRATHWSRGHSPLRRAAQEGHNDVVQYLLDQGASMDPDGPNTLAVSSAARSCSPALVRKLLEMQREASSMDDDSREAFERHQSDAMAVEATRGDNVPVLRMLRQQLGDDRLRVLPRHGHLLAMAAAAGAQGACKELLDMGCRPDVRVMATAAGVGAVEVLRLLAAAEVAGERGLSAADGGLEGWRDAALRAALVTRAPRAGEVVRALVIEYGVSPHLPPDRVTKLGPLGLAAGTTNPGTVDALLDLGVSPGPSASSAGGAHGRSAEEVSPLIAALSMPRLYEVTEWERQGAAGKRTATPANLAAARLQIVRLLLKAGADPNSPLTGRGTDAGAQPLHFAGRNTVPPHIAVQDPVLGHVYRLQYDTARELIAAGAAVGGTRGVDDSTPLHVAVEERHVGVVLALLAAGADQNARRGDCRLARNMSQPDAGKHRMWRQPLSLPGFDAAMRGATENNFGRVVRIFQRCEPEVLRELQHLDPRRRMALACFRRAHEAQRDARLVFRAARDGRPLELQKRLAKGRLAGGLFLRGELVGGGGRGSDGVAALVGPLEAAERGGHVACARVLREALLEIGATPE